MLDSIMLWLSNWGAAVPLLCVLLTHDRKTIENTLLALLLTWGITDVLKLTVMRPRPFLAGAPLIGSAPDGYSFPSQHAAFTFTAATSAVFANRILGIVAFIFAALVAYSRVYLGVHYWSDIIAGALIGSAITTCIHHTRERFERKSRRKKS